MFNQTEIADMVARWPGLGIKLPKELATAVEVFEAVRYIEVGYAPVFKIEDVTAANADAKIRELAEQLLLAPEPGAGLSALERAKKTAVDAAARRLNNNAGPDAFAAYGEAQQEAIPCRRSAAVAVDNDDAPFR
ncbi:MAG TPA: hypothetical protein PKM47_10170 [Mycobacterium sp.]|nr:hypothetical protein [Mycobacterium sp.]